MALDGITIHAIKDELSNALIGKHITKIAQPEETMLIFTFKEIKNGAGKLHISANPSIPFIYLSNENITSPLVAPGFVMGLRKHIQGGVITNVITYDLERIICFEIDHLNEMGDKDKKYLYVELMGKYSNVIFVSKDGIIIDSIKHISKNVSSVREVLPGRKYEFPDNSGKTSIFDLTEDSLKNEIISKPISIGKALYTSINGLSPAYASELCFGSNLDSDMPTASLSDSDILNLYNAIDSLREKIKTSNYSYHIYTDAETHEPKDYSVFDMDLYLGYDAKKFDSISDILRIFYESKNKYTIIRQKSIDIRKIISNHLDRANKKYQLQQKQLKDTEKKDKYKLYGDIILANAYNIPEGSKSATLQNFYDGCDIKIPLDETLSASDNAKKYYDKYNKLKRTFSAVSEQIEITDMNIQHLESLSHALTIAESEADLASIKDELHEYGYIKKSTSKKGKKQEKSNPMHFIDDNGFHIYVGKNNLQNDYLTFKFANGGDMWFHAKNMPGSHVIVKTEGNELPDSTYEYAAELAAYYSKAGGDNSGAVVEVDYAPKKEIKKPAGSPAGFVVYYTNYSMMAKATLEHVHAVS